MTRWALLAGVAAILAVTPQCPQREPTRWRWVIVTREQQADWTYKPVYGLQDIKTETCYAVTSYGTAGRSIPCKY
jgi:hypothetical protein